MKYFTLKEFAKSDTAERLHINNSIPQKYIPGIEEFCAVILDPLREAWGGPLRVTSMYRSPELNQAVKGSATSAHCFAMAVDLQPMDGRAQSDFNNFVKLFLYNRPYDQLIDEHEGSAEWCHIGFKNNKGQQRKQNLIYKNKKYSPWK